MAADSPHRGGPAARGPRWWQRLRQRPAFAVPCFVPPIVPIELFFFRRLFQELCLKKSRRQTVYDSNKLGQPDWAQTVQEESPEVHVVMFQRAMVRLFRVINDDRRFTASDYDPNRNGRVGWYEFCSFWKERGIHVRLSIAERIFLTLEDSEKSILGKVWSMLIFAAIMLSTGSFILSTLPEMQDGCPVYDSPDYNELCRPTPKSIFGIFDRACALLFTVEYVVRLFLSAFMRSELVESEKSLLLSWMVSDEVISMPTRIARVLHWALNWSSLIDLAAILPWYLSLLFESEHEENLFLKIIRLTRVVRAFRLGRRFEAVIIIMRSVRRSLRALYVLVLNLLLGMIIFGALMYFAEQGTWDPETKAYLRWEDDDQDRSPFESIPACFWWAIVTATTVGYGDEHTPTTFPGKLVAGLTMIWSLCVLALPIGVIGGNFTVIWEEYDMMKLQEAENKIQEEIMLKRSIAWGDPLTYSRRLLLEVWHDSGLPTGADVFQSEFMGEVEYSMDLNPDKSVRRRCSRIPLTPNYEKARRKVRGSLTFEYNWEPLTAKDQDTLLCGRLEVTVVGAENVVSIDWRGTADPYCIVAAHPDGPSQDGSVLETLRRTRTIVGTINPYWDDCVTFDMCWTKDASHRGLVADMKQLASVEGCSSMPCTSSCSLVRMRSDRMALSSSQLTQEATPRSRSGTSVSSQAAAPSLPRVGSQAGTGEAGPGLLHAGATSSSVEALSGPPRPASPQPPASPARPPQVYRPSRVIERRKTADTEDIVLRLLPMLQEEVSELKDALPQLHAEVGGLRKTMRHVLHALERQEGQCTCGAAWRPSPDGEPQQASSLKLMD